MLYFTIAVTKAKYHKAFSSAAERFNLPELLGVEGYR